MTAQKDKVCAECGRIAFKTHTDGRAYCWLCLGVVRDEEYQREIDREEGR